MNTHELPGWEWEKCTAAIAGSLSLPMLLSVPEQVTATS
jgi:hypothetical protein